MSDQWIRKVGLVVSTGSQGIDLSNMRIRFRTQNMQADAPNTAWIRVYNLSDNTANSIWSEYTDVSLQAGYESGNYAVIFSGQIMQCKKGKESNVDSYLDIMAADALLAHTFGFVSKSLEQATKEDQVKAIRDELSKMGVTLAPDALRALSGSAVTGGVLPRGKVMWGLAGAKMNDVCDSSATTWSIQNGVLQIVDRAGYKAGEVVKINSQTGMVGIPEATEQGLEVKMLLNPLIGIGGRIQINNAEINQTAVRGAMYPKYGAPPQYARTTEDGFYRVLVAEHSGDTRGQEWYTNVVALALDGAA
jgi:hypothetical protein